MLRHWLRRGILSAVRVLVDQSRALGPNRKPEPRQRVVAKSQTHVALDEETFFCRDTFEVLKKARDLFGWRGSVLGGEGDQPGILDDNIPTLRVP